MKMNKKKGATLVEAMVAIILLMLVALGGAAFIFYSSGRIAIERNKRAAVEIASGRLEFIRSMSYTIQSMLDPQDLDEHDIKYLPPAGGVERWILDQPDLPISINGVSPLNFINKVKQMDINVDGETDYLYVIVEVGYRPGIDNEKIRLETYISPYR